MVNAAYFKGNWASKFNSEETQRKPFYVKRDVIRNVEFMKQKGRFNYYPSELLRAHVLQMPYQGEDISMIIILPPFEDEDLIGEPRNEEEEEEDGEELFGDNMENDYRPMPALDRYDPNILDEDDYDMMSESDRAAAEASMRKRDRELGKI